MAEKRFRFYAIKLGLIIIAVFILQVLFDGFTEFFVLDSSSWFQVWRFATAIFLHGDTVHLIYNLFALLLFGSILEKLIGGKKFLLVFFTTGILANLISVNFYPSSLGASGAIFGVIGALIFVRPSLPVWVFGLPMPIFVAGILWAVGDVMGAFGFGQSEIGNIAHLSGMFFGLLFGALFRKKNKGTARKVVVDERFVRDWENRYMD